MTGRAAPTRRLGPAELAGRGLLVALLVAGAWASRIDPTSMVLFIAYAVVGALLVVRRPRQVIGWVLVGIAFGFLFTTSQPGLDLEQLEAGTGSWPDFLLVWLSSWAGYATFWGFLWLALVFPSGLLPIRGRRGAQALLVVSGSAIVLAAVAPMVPVTPGGTATTILVPNRFAVLPGLPLWETVPFEMLIVPVAVSLIIAVASMLRRYGRAEGVERLQLRWLVAALSTVAFALVFGLVATVLGGDIGLLAWLPALVAFPTVPVSIYIAITRHRLYDIDRVISRTLGWLIVTAAVAGVFVIAVIGLQTVLTPVTGNDTLAVAASTLVAVALFQPLRARIQHAVDRRFNRSRLDAERVVSVLAGAVRDQVDIGRLEVAVVDAADAAVEPARAALWLRGAH
jgi:hypothetical protein